MNFELMDNTIEKAEAICEKAILQDKLNLPNDGINECRNILNQIYGFEK